MNTNSLTFSKLFLKQNLVIISALVAFTTGSLSSASYYHQQRQKDLKVFFECQQAWEKYYSLNNHNNMAIQSQEQHQTFWQVIKQEALKTVQSKLEDSSKPFTKAQESYLVYHYEVLPKCQTLKSWEKYMTSLVKN